MTQALITGSFPAFLLTVTAWLLTGMLAPPAIAAEPVFTRLDSPQVQSLGGVFAMEQDASGFLWFGGKNGLLRYDGYDFRSFRHEAGEPGTLASNDVSDLFTDSRGRLWVALLTTGGLNRFDHQTERFIHFPAVNGDGSVSRYSAYRVAEDPAGRIWIATHERGLLLLDEERQVVISPGDQVAELAGVGIRDIAVDSEGTIWLATVDRGLWQWRSDGSAAQPWQSPPGAGKLRQHLYRLFIDRFDNLWVGSLKSGVSRIESGSGQISHYVHDPAIPHSIGGGMVWDFSEDATGALWLSTRDGTLLRYDKWQDRFERFTPRRHSRHHLSGPVISLFLDRAGDLWLGTYDSRINRLSERLPPFRTLDFPETGQPAASNAITALQQTRDGTVWLAGPAGLAWLYPSEDPQSPRLVRLKIPSSIHAMRADHRNRLWLGTVSHGVFQVRGHCPAGTAENDCKESPTLEPLPGLENTQVWDLYEDRQGALWIGTQLEGLFRYDSAPQDPAAARLVQFRPDPQKRTTTLSHTQVWDILEDQRGRIWIGTQHGLNLFDPVTNRFQHFLHDPLDPESLSDNSVRALAEDEFGYIWAGTTSGLSRYDPRANEFRVYRVRDGLPDDSVTGLLVDASGYLWLTTQKGISRYEETTDSFTHYDTRHGLAANAHPRKAATLRLQDGELWFGSTDGVSRIYPAQVRRNQFKPQVVLTGLNLAGIRQKVQPDGPLGTALDRMASLRLPYPNSVFSLEFAALDYLVPSRNQYAYRLVGFNEQWTQVDSTQRLATYTNLSPGHYTFEVRGSNSDGVWNPQPTQLHIVLEPPFWRSGWAYMLATLVLMAVLGVIWRQFQRKMLTERNARNRAQQMNQFKGQVILGITRELRAPVTAIKELAQNLLQVHGAELPLDAQQSVTRLRERAEHLGEVLDDASRLEGPPGSGPLSLSTRPVNIGALIEEVSAHYRSQAEIAGVRLYTRVETELVIAAGDNKRLHQVLSKLLANALRFTEHGYIEIAAQLRNQWIVIHVKDTGLGMDGKRLARVREKIRRGEAATDAIEGLSFALLGRIVHLHGGRLQVESEIHAGATFTLMIPADPDHTRLR